MENTTAWLQKSEDILQASAFSFYHVGPGDQTDPGHQAWWLSTLPAGPSSGQSLPPLFTWLLHRSRDSNSSGLLGALSCLPLQQPISCSFFYSLSGCESIFNSTVTMPVKGYTFPVYLKWWDCSRYTQNPFAFNFQWCLWKKKIAAELPKLLCSANGQTAKKPNLHKTSFQSSPSLALLVITTQKEWGIWGWGDSSVEKPFDKDCHADNQNPHIDAKQVRRQSTSCSWFIEWSHTMSTLDLYLVHAHTPHLF